LTDTLLETEHPQNRPTTTVEQLPEMVSLCPQECSSCLPAQPLGEGKLENDNQSQPGHTTQNTCPAILSEIEIYR